MRNEAKGKLEPETAKRKECGSYKWIGEEVASRPCSSLPTLLTAQGDASLLPLCKLEDSSPEQPLASGMVYAVDGFPIDWLRCRTASASLHQQQRQSYRCYWTAARYNPI